MDRDVKIHSKPEIGEKLSQFKKLDLQHAISRDMEGNVIRSERLIGEPCYYVDGIPGRRHMVAPIDGTKCAIVSRGIFTGIYDLALFDLLYNIRIAGRTGKGYQEVLIDLDIVLALDGVVPNVKEYYAPLFTSNKQRRRTSFHVDAYCLMTGDLSPMHGYVIHHRLEDWMYRTYNIVENLMKMTISEHGKHHMKKYHARKRLGGK